MSGYTPQSFYRSTDDKRTVETAGEFFHAQP
jgi:hypothetical protein